MEQVIEAAASNTLTDDHYFRLIGQLWAMKRMYYYVYGAWDSSLTIKQYPPSVDYLFAKQVYDESTHEMLYSQALLQKGWAKFQDFHHWLEVVADEYTGEGTCLGYCPVPGALVQYEASSTAGR